MHEWSGFNPHLIIPLPDGNWQSSLGHKTNVFLVLHSTIHHEIRPAGGNIPVSHSPCGALQAPPQSLVLYVLPTSMRELHAQCAISAQASGCTREGLFLDKCHFAVLELLPIHGSDAPAGVTEPYRHRTGCGGMNPPDISALQAGVQS